MKTSDFAIGDRIYYTGDMANDAGWFTVTGFINGQLSLTECADGEDRKKTVTPVMVGDLYQGHCDPRFVTAEAYVEYYEARAIKRTVPQC